MIVKAELETDKFLLLEMIAKRQRNLTAKDLVGDMPFTILANVDEKRGAILGAVLYTNYRDFSIEMTCAGVPGWLTKESLRGFFDFPFNQLGCRRVTGIVHRKNKHARKINERLGFKLEGICRHGFPDGDACIYGMIKKDCRWIDDLWRMRRGKEST